MHEEELTPEEFGAIVNATRDRETLWRRRGGFHDQAEETNLIASALKKLRRQQRRLHSSALSHPND